MVISQNLYRYRDKHCSYGSITEFIITTSLRSTYTTDRLFVMTVNCDVIWLFTRMFHLVADAAAAVLVSSSGISQSF